MKILKKIEIKNHQQEVERLAEIIEENENEFGLSPKSIYEINLSLDEIITNIISYAYTDSSEHIINVTFYREDSYLKIAIDDDGVPFNPLEAKVPDLESPIEDCPIGGLGLHLVRKMMDDVSYRHDNNRNILTLTKKTM
jgi:anti-sigma regulatory factor (Ser/Thr protein kinase)